MKALTAQEHAAIRPDSRDEYGPGFFRFTEVDHWWSSLLFGRVLSMVYQPRTVIEFGCGAGGTLIEMKRLGARVQGVDGSEHCRPFIARHDAELARQVIIHDLAEPFRLPPPFDLAVSVETLEHVPPEGADEAVKTICNHAHRAVVTACPPVGRNPLHLNEQPFEYWVEKFKAHGFAYVPRETAMLKKYMAAFVEPECPIVPSWYLSNYIGVFVEPEPA